MAKNITVTVSWAEDDGSRVSVPLGFMDGLSSSAVIGAVAAARDNMESAGETKKPRIDTTKEAW